MRRNIQIGFLIVFGIVLSLVSIEIFYSIFPNLLPDSFKTSIIRTYDGYLGFKLKPEINFDIKAYDSKFNIVTRKVSSNDIGFRDDGINGEPFAIAVGDSFAFGWGVNISDSWPEILESLIKKDVINMGVPGYSTIQEARLIEKYGAKFNPKVVFLTIFTNDFSDNYIFSTTFDNNLYSLKRLGEEHLVTYMAIRSFYYKLRGEQSSMFLEYNGSENMIFDLSDLDNSYDTLMPQISIGKKLAEQSISDIQKYLAKNNIELILIIIPKKEQIYEDLILSIKPEFVNATIEQKFVTVSMKNFASENGIKYIELEKELSKYRSELLYYPHDGHLTPRGNYVAANAIYKYLIETNMLS